MTTTDHRYRYPFPTPAVVVVPRPTSGTATAALVLSLIGFCVPPLSLMAVVLGHIGYGETQGGRMSGNGRALIALILGYTVVIPCFVFLFMVLAGAFMEGSTR